MGFFDLKFHQFRFQTSKKFVTLQKVKLIFIIQNTLKICQYSRPTYFTDVKLHYKKYVHR